MADDTRVFSFTLTGGVRSTPIDLQVIGQKLGTQLHSPALASLDDPARTDELADAQARAGATHSRTPQDALRILISRALEIGMEKLAPGVRIEVLQPVVPADDPRARALVPDDPDLTGDPA